MSLAETVYEDRGAALIRELLEGERWMGDYARTLEARTPRLALTAQELKLTADVFEKAVGQVLGDNLAALPIPEGTYLSLDCYPVGTLILLDLETKRKGIVSSSGSKLDYDLDYAGQISYLINSSAADLVKLQASRTSSESYKPTRFNVSSGFDVWQYSRLAWFGMVAPLKDSDSHGLVSFHQANPNTLTKDLFQNTFPLSAELMQPALIGETSRSIVKDTAGYEAEQFQRLNEVVIFQEPAFWLDKRVAKAHHSAKGLGRRAVRNLSSACLVRNPK